MTILLSSLKGPHSKLETLRLYRCSLTKKCCEVLASALKASLSSLRKLDLSHDDLHDTGVKWLSAGLQNPNCKLEILRLSFCGVTEEDCNYLASALRSNPSHLRELDLSFNHPGESGLKVLSARLEDPHCRLEKLDMDHNEEFWVKPWLLRKYACKLTLDPDTAHRHLFPSERNEQVRVMENNQQYPDHPERFEHWPQVLCKDGLSGRCYWEEQWNGIETKIGVYSGIGLRLRSG
ncbi:ribonuclease inhibitor-like [Salmo trutta]|uniref:ribonuclease inhibitor-like n=1 Tax=Salmo trutta TaxID=8032 RepID=UPI0011325516|nr:ribonuclease inhibitor-like [Salmo trutta]